MKPFTVVIVGAGKIGAFYDTPRSERVLTHAHAFTGHPGFRLAGFVDTDREQAKRAAAVWGGEVFGTLADACAGEPIDLVVVAAPDRCHYPLLKDLARYRPGMVLAEKPLTQSLAEAREIIGLYRDRGISLALNFSRRFVPEFVALRDRIRSGAFGGYLTGTGFYGKGTLHNGSHMVDLLRFLIGEVAACRTSSRLHDHYPDDPSCSAVLDLADTGQFMMQAVDCRCYTIFELDLLFERRRVRLVDAGARIEEYEVRDSAIFAGYRNPVAVKATVTGLERALGHAAARIHAQLASGGESVCTGEDGLAAQQVCVSMLEGAA